MKDRFKQIIENADKRLLAKKSDFTCLLVTELDSASGKCEALAVEMMIGFAKWIDEGPYFISLYDEKHNRKLIAKFLSENK